METDKVINRFEAGIEAKLINALNKIFSETNNCSEFDAIELKECNCVDPAHCCMVTGKTEEAQRVLSRFVDKNSVPPIPKQSGERKKELVEYWYGSPKAKMLCSSDYFVSMINVLKIYTEYFTITAGNDSPIQIENEHFSFLLAPRIEDD